jgi:drug/metabolite transporter (DMT)-like permease
MRLKSDFILLLVAFIWGSAFAAQRVAADHLGPFIFNALRFFVAVIVLLPIARFRLKVERGILPWVVLAGTALFTASALQQAGMQYTTAGNAGFITGLYVVLVPLVMVIFLRQPVSRWTWVAALIATIGTLLLSTGGELKLNPGDLLELVGAGAWAVHVLLVGWLARRTDVLSFVILQNLVSAVLNVAFSLFTDISTLPGLLPAAWAVLYTGVFSIGVGYALQGMGQRHAPPTDAALILSLEAVFAALFGFFFLDERLLPIQILGCVMILVAIVQVQLRLVSGETVLPS